MSANKPLSGLKVVEMGSLLAGPFAGSLLAQYGAEVIKLESPQGDQIRSWRQQHDGTSLWWYSLNRNKKSVSLDLRREEGRKLAAKILSGADILIENFRPGTMEKWGFGWDELHELNERLIMVRVSGYGQTGPYRDYAGFGAVAEGIGGIRHITGHPDRPPVRVGSPLGDTLAAMFAFAGAMTAVYDRDVRGQNVGQLVDVALYEAVFAMTDSMLPEYDHLGSVRGRHGSKLAGISPSSTYECKDGKYLVIGGNNDAIFRRLMISIGRQEAAEDPRFSSNERRVQNEDEIDEILGAWAQTCTLEEALEVLNAAGVPAGPVYTIADIVKDPQYLFRNMIEEVEVSDLGPLRMPGVVPKFPRYDLATEWAGPRLGEHTQSILGALGIPEEDLTEMREAGVIVWPEDRA